LGGCANNANLIKESSVSTRTDVFEETPAEGKVPEGYADLLIIASLKTHKPGIFSSSDRHGTKDYRLLANIDGQSITLSGSLVMEDNGTREMRDPEAGEGIRYLFSKRVRLKAGAHGVVIALPDDDVAVEVEIELAEGSRNTLHLEPLYGLKREKQRPGFYGDTTFSEGIREFRAFLNGKQI
jgi:hypothetical protein